MNVSDYGLEDHDEENGDGKFWITCLEEVLYHDSVVCQMPRVCYNPVLA